MFYFRYCERKFFIQQITMPAMGLSKKYYTIFYTHYIGSTSKIKTFKHLNIITPITVF